MAAQQIISGDYGRGTPSNDTTKMEELHMSTVALIDRKMNEVVKTVETERVQWTIDQLMRNRDPRLFVARELTKNNS
jgi:hypothetical protein